ncbi:MAG: hypothetical protein U5K69_21560 [Balneolaceae bacterium]|nr:hypothetical protein [Balneolaceae bacterium]
MGQQQILIVILVTVIIALATIIAVDTMQESRKNANRDAMQQDILFIINEAQAYYLRSSIFQGGGGSFSGIEFSDISIGDSTANGTYSMNGNEQSLVVEGTGTSYDVSLRADAQFQNGDLQVEWTDE